MLDMRCCQAFQKHWETLSGLSRNVLNRLGTVFLGHFIIMVLMCLCCNDSSDACFRTSYSLLLCRIPIVHFLCAVEYAACLMLVT